MNRAGLDDVYKFDDTGFIYGDEHLPEQRSCFYDFGAKRSAGFSGYSAEPESAFIKSLREKFFSQDG